MTPDQIVGLAIAAAFLLYGIFSEKPNARNPQRGELMFDGER